MSLHNLKREYEERRQALIDQLQRNPQLDPATQHQIYGAIKEIENFLKTIEYQTALTDDNSQQPKPVRPNRLTQQTKGAVYHVAHGTKRVFTEHIPNATKKVVGAPKRYFDRKREEARLRREIQAEIQAHRAAEAAAPPVPQSTEHLTLEHPHQDLAVRHEEPPLPTWSDETVQRAQEPIPELPAPRMVNNHVHRPHVVARTVKKPRLSKNAPGKKKGQHKPHLKKGKAPRFRNARRG